jgi:hypothetical protein
MWWCACLYRFTLSYSVCAHYALNERESIARPDLLDPERAFDLHSLSRARHINSHQEGSNEASLYVRNGVLGRARGGRVRPDTHRSVWVDRRLELELRADRHIDRLSQARQLERDGYVRVRDEWINGGQQREWRWVHPHGCVPCWFGLQQRRRVEHWFVGWRVGHRFGRQRDRYHRQRFVQQP